MARKKRQRKQNRSGKPGASKADGPRYLAAPFEEIRQLQFPAEFRISPSIEAGPPPEAQEGEGNTDPVSEAESGPVMIPETGASDRVLAEVATCLWYLKTKHFKTGWGDFDETEADPRDRRALGRISRGIDALSKDGIEVQDPTNMRYPPGGEGMMKPIQFLPTTGLTYELVSETVKPIIYREDRLIQRGEVFVAVPASPESTKTIDGNTSHSSQPQPSVRNEAEDLDPSQSSSQNIARPGEENRSPTINHED